MSTDNIQQVINSLLLVAAVAVLLMVTLIVWATILLFQVQAALERLQRALNSGPLRSNGAPSRLKERL